jgi:integrase
MGGVGSGNALGRGRLLKLTRGAVTVWRAEWTDASGKRRRIQLGSSRADAERALAKIVRDRDLERMGLKQEGNMNVPLEQVLDDYVADLETRARPRGVASMRQALKPVRRHFAGRRVRDINRAGVLSYRQARLGAGLARSTVNGEIDALHAALTFAARFDLIGENPIAGVPKLPVRPEHRRRTARALSEDEIARFLAAAEELDGATRDRFPRAPLLRVLIATGARWSEVTTLTWRDFDERDRKLHLRAERTKTGIGRSVPIGADTCAVLRALRPEIARITGALPGPDSRIFRRASGAPWGPGTSGLRNYFREALERAAIPRVTAEGRLHVHAMRHTFATRCARAGIPIQQAQRLTGHKTLAILSGIYTHLEAEDVREAIAKLPPLPAPGVLQERAGSHSGEPSLASGA